MTVYLHDIPLETAQERLQSALEAGGLWQRIGEETIPLDEHALGRVTAAPVWALLSSPHYHAAAMDGFAVRAADTAGAQPTAPLTLAVIGGGANRASTALHDVALRPCTYVDTGDPLPDWADAIIPVELTEPTLEAGGNAVEIRRPPQIRIRASVAPWSHVRPLGEDIVATQMVLPAGHTLRPADLGAIAAAGHTHISVARRPRVAILPTGTELIPVGVKPSRGKIIEYNSIVMAAQIAAFGGEARRSPIIADDLDQICRGLTAAAAEHDLILLNAGSSAGEEDFAAAAIEKLGTVLLHGIAVRPGHPVVIGMIRRPGQEKPVPVIGVPGFPVSAALTLDLIVEPLVSKWLGRREKAFDVVEAAITRKLVSPPGDDDFVRVSLGMVNGRLLAAPLPRGAGVISSLVQADGLALLPRGVQGLEEGERVSVRLLRTASEMRNTIFCVGSHDMTLDLLSEELIERDRRMVIVNVGSQAGLIALARGYAHLAGSHLLDPESGEYNISFLRQYVPRKRLRLVALVERQQGLLVMPGNPKGIRQLEDLARGDVRFVNRQRGAGTRVLLDYHLDRVGILPANVRGYNEEQYTHLNVAAAVASGRADTGLGIAAAASALGLDFVPLFRERYDLVMPVGDEDEPLLVPILEVLNAGSFRAAVGKWPGYDTSVTGSVLVET